MERELPPYRAAVTKPARPSIWPTLLIGLTLAAVIAGGFHLLAQTRLRWENNRIDRTTKAAKFEQEWAASQAPAPSSRPIETEPREPMRNPNLRCINGQLFRKLPNGWENIPRERC